MSTMHDEVSAMVEVRVDDSSTSMRVTFKNTEWPRDTVATVAHLLPLYRNVDFSKFMLFNSKGSILTGFGTVQHEDTLHYYDPNPLVPMNGDKWAQAQMDKLKVVFCRAENVQEFFDGTLLRDYSSCPRGDNVKIILRDLSSSTRMHFPLDPAAQFNTAPLLQHPITKSVFATRRQESLVPNFVHSLLHELGFNTGMLYVAPQMELPLRYGDSEKQVTTQHTVVDVLTSPLICVCEDRIDRNKLIDCTPQLVAAGIAVTQMRTEAKSGGMKQGTDNAVASVLEKRALSTDSQTETDQVAQDTQDSDTEAAPAGEAQPVFGIRVLGSYFWFVRMEVSPAMLAAMSRRLGPEAYTTFLSYGGPGGLDFMDRVDREKIIDTLVLLRRLVEKIGETV